MTMHTSGKKEHRDDEAFDLRICGVSVAQSPAERLMLLEALANGVPMYDDEGDYIGQTPALIDKETFLALLNAPLKR